MENPELLSGIPLLILGAIGLAMAFGAAFIPERSAAPAGQQVAAHGAHPGVTEYIGVGIVLAVLTAIEVALYYIDVSQKPLIATLLILSGAKFVVVVMWFMHLKFDSKLFSSLFVTGFILAAAVFAVVIASLDAGLV